MNTIDLSLFNYINYYSKKSKTLDLLAVFCAEQLGYALIVFLLVLAVISQRWFLFFVPLITGLTARFLITTGIYLFYQRRRPSDVLPINALVKKPKHPSFPSGHASFFFGMACGLLFINIPLAIAYMVASCLISLARIFCGVHWPSDVIAGAGSAVVASLVLKGFI